MMRFRKWLNKVNDTENEQINVMIDHYDALISEYVNLIPLADVIGLDADDDLKKLSGIYKDTMELMNDTFNVMIAQDDQLRKITKQNDEIIKKLDMLSRKTE